MSGAKPRLDDRVSDIFLSAISGIFPGCSGNNKTSAQICIQCDPSLTRLARSTNPPHKRRGLLTRVSPLPERKGKSTSARQGDQSSSRALPEKGSAARLVLYISHREIFFQPIQEPSRHRPGQ